MPTKSKRIDASRLIARIWRGKTQTERADEYERYLQATGFKDYDTTDGNMGLIALRKSDPGSGTTEFLLISLWKSLGSIQEFAGDNIEKAVYYPRDKEFLLEMEPTVSHYDVVSSISKPPASRGRTRTSKSRKQK
jgi:heme-degrading monooxygenase HmoA